MAAYVMTGMPFYGVQKAGRIPVLGILKREYPPQDGTEYAAAVLALWNLPHREEKHLAIGYARAFTEYMVAEAMELYEQMIIEGAWWDFADEIAAQLVGGGVLLDDRSTVEATNRSWIVHDGMWLRRTSVICQLKHEVGTDTQLLGDACTANLRDTEFYIRKAIG